MNTKSTYSLLLNAESEEKARSIFEVAVYAIIILCIAFSGWHSASGTVTVPGQNRVEQSPERVIVNSPDESSPRLIASRG